LIVDYIRNELKFKTIGVHGESLGGFVATHVASAKNLDFLCADRTFSSLSSIANIGFNRFLFYLFKSITTWDRNSSLNYLNSNCYKLVFY
jgi:hypothetical protein